MGVFEARKGTTLAVSRIDARLGGCGQVVAVDLVTEAGAFIVEVFFLILKFGLLAFIIGHGDVAGGGQ